MANGPTLPPQAYTREVLAVAFQWLQGQPDSIRKLAQSPDALVGLYLRAQRYGHASPETDAPVTSQNFVNDLKSLAEGLKQFEESKAAQGEPNAAGPAAVAGSYAYERRQYSYTSPQSQSQPQPQSPVQPSFHSAQSSAQSHIHSAIGAGGVRAALHPPTAIAPPVAVAAQAITAQTVATPAADAVPTANLARHLNANAQAMIQEVKTAMNLSSDAEVLNMMVALAYKSVRNLLA